MNDDSLFSLSPLDGRYVAQTKLLRNYFSEFALMKYRLQIECDYLLFLSKWNIIRVIKQKEKKLLNTIVKNFSLDDAKRIKIFESETKHDVKAIEYFLKDKLAETSLENLLPFIHFCLTSDDVNAIAYGLMLKHGHEEVLLHEFKNVLTAIRAAARPYTGSVILAKTHGQPAVPTTFGKELSVFYARLKKIQKNFYVFRFEGILNGAVGNYNAMISIRPDIDWIKLSKTFITSLGLEANVMTTQILPYDRWAEYSMMLSHINGVLIGLCQDMWQYVSLGLVMQKRDPKQVGSSTMPHKINPIDFENAEGNLQIANSYFELYSRKLLVSRLQRDLSDSTVKRTIGTALGHTILAWTSLERGLGNISFNKEAAVTELNTHWEILSEAVQIYMKVHGDEKGYEKVKILTHGKQLNENTFREVVKQFPPLAKLSPLSYSGLAKKLALLALSEAEGKS